MKLNLEIDLDWIDEEKGLDETVKEQIIDGVVSQIEAKINTKIEKKINDVIDEQIANKINERVDAIFTDFINRPVTLTDGYGGKLKVYDSIEALVKERFDNLLNQPVDDKGNTVNFDSYGHKQKRLDFIVNKQMKDYADKFTSEAVKKVSEEIKLHVQDGLTTKLGSELMKVLKVNEMLQLNKG